MNHVTIIGTVTAKAGNPCRELQALLSAQVEPDPPRKLAASTMTSMSMQTDHVRLCLL